MLKIEQFIAFMLVSLGLVCTKNVIDGKCLLAILQDVWSGKSHWQLENDVSTLGKICSLFVRVGDSISRTRVFTDENTKLGSEKRTSNRQRELGIVF